MGKRKASTRIPFVVRQRKDMVTNLEKCCSLRGQRSCAFLISFNRYALYVATTVVALQRLVRSHRVERNESS